MDNLHVSEDLFVSEVEVLGGFVNGVRDHDWCFKFRQDFGAVSHRKHSLAVFESNFLTEKAFLDGVVSTKQIILVWNLLKLSNTHNQSDPR